MINTCVLTSSETRPPPRRALVAHNSFLASVADGPEVPPPRPTKDGAKLSLILPKRYYRPPPTTPLLRCSRRADRPRCLQGGGLWASTTRRRRYAKPRREGNAINFVALIYFLPFFFFHASIHFCASAAFGSAAPDAPLLPPLPVWRGEKRGRTPSVVWRTGLRETKRHELSLRRHSTFVPLTRFFQAAIHAAASAALSAAEAAFGCGCRATE